MGTETSVPCAQTSSNILQGAEGTLAEDSHTGEVYCQACISFYFIPRSSSLWVTHSYEVAIIWL